MGEELQDVPESVREDIERRANVIGTAVGPIRENDQPTDETGVVVLVTEKMPEDTLSRQDLVPERVRIDGNQYKTQVIEVGQLNAQGAGGQEIAGGPDAMRRREAITERERRRGQEVVGRSRERVEQLQEATMPIAEHVPLLENRKRSWRPAPAGVSVAHTEVTAGTLGSPPLKTADDRTVFLTNAHVAAPIDESASGDPIIQPGPADGGSSQDVIGHLLEWSLISRDEPNVCDSALVEIDDGLVEDDILALGDLAGWEEPELRTEYIKSGRTTGVTSGELLARGARVPIGGYYPGEPTYFEGVDVFGPMSAGGDSGSIIGIQREDGFYGTHLLFAGSDRATIGIPVSVVQDLHGPLTPVGAQATGERTTTPAGRFNQQVHQRLVTRFGSGNVETGGDGRAPDYRVDAWPVQLAVVVADDREGAMDAVGRAVASADGQTVPVVVYPADAGERPVIQGSGVAVIPVEPA